MPACVTMKKFRSKILSVWTLVAVLLFSLAGNHHHHGARVCLTFRHERTADASHRHSACPDGFAAEAAGEAPAGLTDAPCHRHCTTRICTARRQAALTVSRTRIPNKLLPSGGSSLVAGWGPACRIALSPAVARSLPHAPPCLGHPCASGGLSWSLRAPPSC